MWVKPPEPPCHTPSNSARRSFHSSRLATHARLTLAAAPFVAATAIIQNQFLHPPYGAGALLQSAKCQRAKGLTWRGESRRCCSGRRARRRSDSPTGSTGRRRSSGRHDEPGTSPHKKTPRGRLPHRSHSRYSTCPTPTRTRFHSCRTGPRHWGPFALQDALCCSHNRSTNQSHQGCCPACNPFP